MRPTRSMQLGELIREARVAQGEDRVTGVLDQRDLDATPLGAMAGTASDGSQPKLNTSDHASTGCAAAHSAAVAARCPIAPVPHI